MKLQELIKAIKKAQKDETVRLITLEDVLIVLGEKYAMSGEGILLERRYGTFAYDCTGMRYWYLKDDLEKQSPETISFLHDLICK